MCAKKIGLLLLALCLLCAPALADAVVGEGGDSWVRSGPGRDYDDLAVLPEGEICEFLGSTAEDERGVIWYRVRCGGVEGWVSSRYTALVSSGEGGWTWGDGAVVYVRATGDVNVRSGPGVNYEDLGVLARGECLTYLDETRYDANGHAWYKAQYYSYGEVWVSSVYSELTSTRTQADDGEAGTFGSYIQATGRLNVRSGPGLNYESIAILQDGATAAYLDQYALDERGVTWYMISCNGGSGWVSSRYCALY